MALIHEESLYQAIYDLTKDEDLTKELVGKMRVENKDDLNMSESLKNAIMTILQGGQSYKIGNMFLERARLKDLIDAYKTIGNVDKDNSDDDLLDNTKAVYFGRR